MGPWLGYPAPAMPSGTGQHVAERKNKTSYEAYDSAVLALKVGSLFACIATTTAATKY